MATSTATVSLGGLRVGSTLGRYELLHELASGGMATVYLGRARGAAGFERVVALKVCHPHLRTDEEFAAMFLDEARLAARIHHPNVVSTLDVGVAETLFLVMEYLDGERLGSLIRAAVKRKERVPPPVALRIMVETLAGLHAAHELDDGEGAPLGLVHRDVSLQNILVGVDGVTKLVDFGIAKAAARATVTRDGQLKGKLGYLAPEQVQGVPVDRRADLYAASVVLWETLTGQRLFQGDNDAAVLQRVLAGSVPPPSALAQGITPALDAAILRALSVDRDARFATAAEFAEALERSGVPQASTREVAAYVRERCAESISQRRALLRSLTSSLSHSLPPPPLVEPAEGPKEVSGVSAVGSRKSTAPPASRGLLLGLGVAVLLVLVLGVLLLRALRAAPQTPALGAPPRPAPTPPAVLVPVPVPVTAPPPPPPPPPPPAVTQEPAPVAEVPESPESPAAQAARGAAPARGARAPRGTAAPPAPPVAAPPPPPSEPNAEDFRPTRI